MDAVEKIVPYYALIVRDLFLDKKGASDTFGHLAGKFREQHKQQFGFLPHGEFQERMLLHAVRFLVHSNAIFVVRDDFAPEFLIWSIKGAAQLVAISPPAQAILDKIGKIGGPDRGRFLFEAVRGFEHKHLKEAVEYLDSIEHAYTPSEDSDSESEELEAEISEEESWEPLKIDRESPEAIDAIQKSEAALKEIEQSNGYTASENEERNGIVATIRGTLDSIKTGSPSRGAIVAGLLAPLKFIAKKFSEASIGETAKIAVAALIKWLF